MENKEAKPKTIKYEDYIIFGDPRTSDFQIDYSRFNASKFGVVVISEETQINFKKYYDLMIKEDYFYTKPKVAAIFDFNNHFVQKFMKKDFKLLFISKSVREVLKSAEYIKRKKIFEEEKHLIDKEIQIKYYNMSCELLKKISYRDKIFYGKYDILKWIKANMKREELHELIDISDEEALEIFKKGVISNKTIKELYDVEHDMQTTRIIKRGLTSGKFRKYILFNTGEERPVIRYLVN